MDVMIDFETLGRTPDTVVIQIGACYFDRQTGEIGDMYQTNIDIQSEINAGFRVDGSTIKWWMKQSREAQKSVLALPLVASANAWFRLNDFVRRCKHIWSHATFDIPIFIAHLDRFKMYPTFRYTLARDIRTVVDLAEMDWSNVKDVGVAHHAIDDCIKQANYVSDCLKKIKVIKSIP